MLIMFFNGYLTNGDDGNGEGGHEIKQIFSIFILFSHLLTQETSHLLIELSVFLGAFPIPHRGGRRREWKGR